MVPLDKYLELTKPRVTSLNVAVGITCFILAELPRIDWPTLILFGTVAYLTVGGCGALNCYFDRDLDKLMDRTCRRAIPSGVITPINALLYGLILLTVGVFGAYFTFGGLAFGMIVMGATVYLFVYTRWLKRRSRWNVVVGGVSGSFAALFRLGRNRQRVQFDADVGGSAGFLVDSGAFVGPCHRKGQGVSRCVCANASCRTRHRNRFAIHLLIQRAHLHIFLDVSPIWIGRASIFGGRGLCRCSTAVQELETVEVAVRRPGFKTVSIVSCLSVMHDDCPHR